MSSKSETGKETTTAAATVGWKKSYNYDEGQYPSVAINDAGQAIEMHGTESLFKYGLFYHVGPIGPDKVDFGSSHSRDKGQVPRIALSGGAVVEIHQAEANRELWYTFGGLLVKNKKPQDIVWGQSVDLDEAGSSPVIAMSAGVVVQIHVSPGGDSTLWYRVGRANPTTMRVDWAKKSTKYIPAFDPSVAINSAGVVVEVHGMGDDVNYSVGQIDGDAIRWGDELRVDGGNTPSVAINDSGLAVAVHCSSKANTLWCQTGQIDVAAKTIAWGSSSKYEDSGLMPTVAINNKGSIVEVHASASVGKYGLWSRVGKIS